MSVLNDISGLWHAVMNLGLGTQISAVLYPYQKAYHDGRFAGGRSASSPPIAGRRVRGSPLRGLRAVLGLGRGQDQETPASYTFPGRVLAHRWYTPDMGSPDCGWHSQQFLLTCENALVQLTVLAPDLVRVRVSPTGRFSAPFSYAIAKEDDKWSASPRSAGLWPTDLRPGGQRLGVECSTEETEEALIIRTSRLHVHIAKAHLRLTWLDPDGTVIHADAAGAGWQDDKVYHWKHMPIDEHIYGLGEKTLPLDKRGLTAAPQQILVDGDRVTCLKGPGVAFQAGRFDARARLCPPAEGTNLSRPPFVLETGMFHTIEVQM